MFEFARSAERLPDVPLDPPSLELCDDSRHARLFELLRQQSLSKRATQRIDRKAFTRASKDNNLLLQNAAASFQAQKAG